jgi:hypothetical protein
LSRFGIHRPDSGLAVGQVKARLYGGRLSVGTSVATDPALTVFHPQSAAPLLALQTVLRVPATLRFFATALQSEGTTEGEILLTGAWQSGLPIASIPN